MLVEACELDAQLAGGSNCFTHAEAARHQEQQNEHARDSFLPTGEPEERKTTESAGAGRGPWYEAPASKNIAVKDAVRREAELPLPQHPLGVSHVPGAKVR